MEQKKKLKPNVRIEPKIATSKVTQKNSSQSRKEFEGNLIDNNSSAKNKADEMESGFVKTRKNPLPQETVPANAQTTNKAIPSSKDILSTHKYTNTDGNFENNPNATTGTSAQNDNKNGLQITLSPSTCVTAFVTLLVTIAFVFLFGLIIGKGMVPTADKIEPEKLLPQAQITEEKTEILPKEELQFMTSLKTETAEKIPTDENSFIDPKTNEVRTQAATIPADKIIPSTRLYDFNIRVAAFRKKDQAEILRPKLEGLGFRTLLVTKKDPKGNWYYVHVLLRGNETRLQEAQNSFKKFGIRDSIVKEQKEIK